MNPPYSASFRDAAGKTLVLTSVQLAGDAQINIALLRFNGDGSIDTSFNPAGTYPGMNRRYISDQGSTGAQIAQDSLGRYYVVGTAGVGSGLAAFVARFNNNGTNDFSLNDTVNDHVRVYFGTGTTSTCSEGDSIRVDTGGKIYIGGRTQQCSVPGNVISWRYGAMSRHNDDGGLDGTFNAGGPRPGTLVLPTAPDRGVARMLSPIDDSTGNLLVPFGTTSGFCLACGPELHLFDVRVLRVSPSGVLDALYGGGVGYLECNACSSGGALAEIAAAVEATDGRLYVASQGRPPVGINPAFPPVIMRLAADGSRDLSFGNAGEFLPTASLAAGYVVQRDLAFDNLGRLVVQGQVQYTTASVPVVDLLLQRYTVDPLGAQTVGIYIPTTGTFFLKNDNGPGNADTAFGYGPTSSTLAAVVGDWNGDGGQTIWSVRPCHGRVLPQEFECRRCRGYRLRLRPCGRRAGCHWRETGTAMGSTPLGLYDPSTGNFFLRNTNSPGAADIVFGFGPGGAGWKPLVGDWNGDGIDTVGLYDPSTGNFFLKSTNTPGPADIVFGFGPPNATPLVGDWNNDGTVTVGIYVSVRPGPGSCAIPTHRARPISFSHSARPTRPRWWGTGTAQRPRKPLDYRQTGGCTRFGY